MRGSNRLKHVEGIRGREREKKLCGEIINEVEDNRNAINGSSVLNPDGSHRVQYGCHYSPSPLPPERGHAKIISSKLMSKQIFGDPFGAS